MLFYFVIQVQGTTWSHSKTMPKFLELSSSLLVQQQSTLPVSGFYIYAFDQLQNYIL